jgi:hypothetical protein
VGHCFYIVRACSLRVDPPPLRALDALETASEEAVAAGAAALRVLARAVENLPPRSPANLSLMRLVMTLAPPIVCLRTPLAADAAYAPSFAQRLTQKFVHWGPSGSPRPHPRAPSARQGSINRHIDPHQCQRAGRCSTADAIFTLPPFVNAVVAAVDSSSHTRAIAALDVALSADGRMAFPALEQILSNTLDVPPPLLGDPSVDGLFRSGRVPQPTRCVRRSRRGACPRHANHSLRFASKRRCTNISGSSCASPSV